MELLKEKIEYLCFWQEVKDGEVSQDKSQKERSFKRAFPTSNSTVYHFHPIAFVEHMKLITGGRAPWMEIAYRELGVEEIEGSKHNEKVLEYHNSSNSKGEPDEIAWCGAYVNWVMKQAGYSSLPDAPSKAVRWKKFGKSVSKDHPPYGAIASIAWTSDTNWGAGHVGFVVAVKDDTYYLLGGNQKGGDKKTKGKVCVSKYKKSDILSVNIPANYNVSDSDYEYDKVNKNKSGQYETLQSTR